ncbi:MAG TPA: helix-turn-helix transcriptional regulator [Sphingobacteriaceae bacterium]
MSSTHIGRKISRLRELRGWKQESLAAELGISQQAVSKMEQSEKIEEQVLERISKALNIPVEGIKNFDENSIIQTIQNNYDHATAAIHGQNLNCTFNPLDKLIEAIEENRKLYERLLASEREKIEWLQGKKD